MNLKGGVTVELRVYLPGSPNEQETLAEKIAEIQAHYILNRIAEQEFTVQQKKLLLEKVIRAISAKGE